MPDSATTTHALDRTARIRALNDRLRTHFTGGRIMVTAGVQALTHGRFAQAVVAFCAGAEFTPGNDPYDEHDFGSFHVDGTRLYWKIDYYDLTLTAGSPDPADPAVTTRVLTIMLASEY